MDKQTTLERGTQYTRGYLKGYRDGFAAGKNGIPGAPELLQMPVEALGISARVVNALHRYEYYRIADILDLPFEKIYAMGNIGEKTAQEITRALHRHNLMGTAWDDFLL